MTPRVLVVGLGSIGRRHLEILRSMLPNAQIMVLRHKPVTEQVDLADTTTCSFNDVLTFQPEFAVLANPATQHADIAQKLLALGCHLLIEKPLAESVVAGQAILLAAQVKRRICRVGYNLRYLPSLQEFRHRLDEGTIGRVLSVRCEIGQFLGSWRTGSDYRQGVSARRELGGGVLLELSHELDYLSWIFGRIEWVSAWLAQQSSLEINVEDTAHLILGFQSSQGEKIVATLNLDFVRHDTTRRCVAIGEKGSLLWDAVRGTVEVWLEGDNDWSTLYKDTPDRNFTYIAQWESFLKCMAGNSNLETSYGASLQEALDVLHVVEAARKSTLHYGLQVKLPGGVPHVR